MSPPDSRPLFDAPAPAVKAAGAWLARRDRGFAADEAARFEAWLRSDPDHRAALAQLEETWTVFDGLRELAAHEGVEPDPDAFAPPPARPRPGLLRFVAFASLATAAAVAALLWPGAPAPASSIWHYATAAAGYERALLPDGSTVELNADTALDVEFTPAERHVRLAHGEARFQVAKNLARPFVVQAGAVAVRAVGTAFNVRIAPAAVEVLVTEGKVHVDPRRTGSVPPANPPAAELPLITAGQRIVVGADYPASPALITSVDGPELATAFASRPVIAEFVRQPLPDVVAEFNRRNRLQLVIDDPALTALKLGGSFRTDQPEAFVRLLEQSFGVATQRTGDTVTLRAAP